MTEEEKLKSSLGCGSLIILGLIAIVLLSLAGVIFPIELLPYPTEILVGVLVIAMIALVIFLLMAWGKRKEKQREADAKADQFLRQHHHTLGHQDDEATKLAEKYAEQE